MDSSPFALLPGELRNLIWEHVLDDPIGIPISSRKPGLLQTCRAIKQESELMFYALNNFHVVIHEDNIQHSVCQWLQNLGEAKRKLIRSLHVHCVIASASEAEESAFDQEEKSFMELMHLLDSIRGTDFGRRLEHVVSFSVSTSEDDELDPIFHDNMSFAEMDGMSPEKQECYRAAKFLILCCVYGKEVLVDAMQSQDGEAPIADLDRRMRESREGFAKAKIVGSRFEEVS